MMKPIRAGAASVALMIAAGLPALAQASANCGPREVVIHQLANSYGESRQSIGIGANNTVVEVFGNQETGSWTITVTRPGGPTCLVASGMAFENIAQTSAESDQGA